MGWRWTARRWIVSAFVVFHLAATLIVVLPQCPIRQRSIGWVSYYVSPLGLWQYWGMFAPNPPRESYTLEADVVDTLGIQHRFAFPRVADYSKLGAVARFRHPKFAANLLGDEAGIHSTLTARHAVRQLGLPAEAFPVSVRLVYMVRKLPEFGTAADEAPLAPQPMLQKVVRIASIDEVRP